MNDFSISTFRFLSALTMCSLSISLLSACNKESDQKVSTQVVAKVNDAEISMHQLNQVMKEIPNLTAENAVETRKLVLERLVDQQIVIEKANKESLDRSPDVIMAIETAKKDILAKAYLQKILANAAQINDREVKKYYAENKSLFANRRIYGLQDIVTDTSAETLMLLNASVEQGKTIQEIASSLQEKGIKYAGTAYTLPAEQLPLDVLPKLQNLNVGDTIVLTIDNNAHLLNITKIQNAPLNLAAATPSIKNYFVNTRGKALIEEKIKQFRQEAKIEYMGDFTVLADKSKNMPAKKDMQSTSINAGVAGLK